MQPGEFYKWLEGCDARQEKQDYRTAYFLSWLLSPYGKVDYRKIAAPLWKGKHKHSESDAEFLAKERKALLKEFGLKEVK